MCSSGKLQFASFICFVSGGYSSNTRPQPITEDAHRRRDDQRMPNMNITAAGIIYINKANY